MSGEMSGSNWPKRDLALAAPDNGQMIPAQAALRVRTLLILVGRALVFVVGRARQRR